jgi:hypothetical protein
MSLTKQIAQIVGDLSSRTGVNLPATLTVRFHPTVESFRRETGHPWWVAGATRDTRIDLLPLAVLRERGLFPRTVRHEIVHALVDEELRDRPMWVREGVALHFAGEKPAAGSMTGTCPEDDDFRRASSAAGLKAAYARALACVERSIAAGAPWRSLR